MTTEGKRQIMRYLAGQTRALGGSLALGSGTTPPTVDDTRLTYEFDRATIYLSSPDYINNQIIFKGTIQEGTLGSIYEVGLFSSPYETSGARSIASFEQGYESWSSDTYCAGNQRVGLYALRLAPASSGTLTSTLSSVGLDISDYLNSDILSLAFYNSNSNASSVRVRFRAADPAAYYEYVVSNPATGYNVATFARSAMTKVGSVDFASIDSIEVSVSAKAAGAAQVDFDGIRIEPVTMDPDNILISRALPATPVVKADYAAMDIEYALEVTQ